MILRNRGIILACLVAACLAGAGSAAAGGLRTGILDPSVLSGAEGQIAAKRVWNAGARSVRLPLTWARVAPAVEPTDPTNPCSTDYKWTAFDALVNRVVSAGLEPVVYVLGAPSWAEASGRAAWMNSGTFKPSPTKLAQFAEAAARRYSGADPCGVSVPRILHWQVWNEPNLPHFLNPQYDSNGRPFSPTWYRMMVNSFASAVHAVSSANVVIAGGTAPYGGNGRVRPLAFMRKLLCLSKKLTVACSHRTQFDVWSTHPYTYGAPTRHALAADDVAIADLPEMRRVLRAALAKGRIVTAKSGVPFWVTEISWDTRPPDPGGVPLKLHARWTAEGLYWMWRGGVSQLFWFMLRDRPYPAERWQSGFYFCGAASTADDGTCATGSLAGDVRKSRSHQAFRFPFVAFAGNGRLSVWGRIPPDKLGATYVVIQRRTSRGWKKVATVGIRSGGIFTKRWSSSLTKGYLRAQIPRRESSVPFSLKRPSSQTFRPFGCGGDANC